MAELMSGKLKDQAIERIVQDASTAMRKGDVAAAHAVAERGIAEGIEHPFLLKVEALWLHNNGQYRDALRTFHHARTLTPDDPMILNGIAGCLAGMGEYNAALKMVDASFELAPDASPTHYLCGWILEAARDYPAARASYERATSLDPAHIQALAGLACVAVRLEDFAAARAWAARALALDSLQPTATIALAMAEIELGEAPAAEDRARNLLKISARLPNRARAMALGVLGDALDAQDRTTEAFIAWREKAEGFHQATATAEPLAIDRLAPLAAHLDAMPVGSWRRTEMPRPFEGEPRAHVFLLGFPCSGTALLEQVLAVHPDVLSLDERGSLRDLTRQFIDTPDGLDSLAALEGVALDDARTAYWQRMREFGLETTGKVLVDKEPLNTINLPLISKLFPEAKVVFAVRDPRDVVFSCYRSYFDVDSIKPEFSTLEDCSRFYAAVMNLGGLCRARLPLTLYEHRYEDTIEDFEGRGRAVCDFLAVKWTDAMSNLSEKARRRSALGADRVGSLLHHEGVGQWRRYAQQLAPMMPILEPWIRKLGYH
jgi:tetratricopeptide (TPR) repeat protein